METQESKVQYTVNVIAPGFVHIKNFLSEKVQVKLCEFALTLGNDERWGFWKKLQNGEKILNSAKDRGRIYDAISKFPDFDFVKDLCLAVNNIAREHDSKMPLTDPTHLLLLYYAGDEGMYWHRDSDKNDGDNNHPVVSISIGNACDFGYKFFGRKEECVKLESGDIVLFGGPNRMLEHCVQKVYMETSPSFLPLQNVRLNFTFRDVHGILGQESKYAEFVEVDNPQHKELIDLITKK